MKKNVGKIDQIARLALGVGFLVLAIFVNWWFLVGTAIMIGTAVTQRCPLYQLIGISTYKLEDK